MSALRSPPNTAKQACSRCRDHKRKCDRVVPSCSLCKRLRNTCRYDYAASSYSTPSGLPVTENAFTPHSIKAAMVQRLSDFRPKEIVSIYSRSLHPWFGFSSDERLCNQLQTTWDDCKVDSTLLACTILLFNADSQSLEGVYSLHLDDRTFYLSCKSWITLLEGAGINSINLVYSRLLVTLFEVVHGFYPAAYLSIAATIRAADALFIFDEKGTPLNLSSGLIGLKEEEECREMWCGIFILDRYLAVENGKPHPLTRGRTVPDCQNPFGINSEVDLSLYHRSFEASCLLDKVHIAIYEPTTQQDFNNEEISMIVRALTSFETIAKQDLAGKSLLSSTGLAFARIGLLLAYENGTKAFSDNQETSQCRFSSIAALKDLLEGVLKLFEGLEASTMVDAQVISPFMLHFVYKAAAIIGEGLQTSPHLEMDLQKVRHLRRILKFMGRQWLAGERYLRILNEDTTPRMLKAIEYGS